MHDKDLGEFIRAARVRAHMSAPDLAHHISRSSTWLYRVETGDRGRAEPRDLEAVATILHLSAWEHRYLYLLAGFPPPPSGFGDQPLGEYLERLTEPTCWISFDGPSYFNAEFRRIFKNVEDYRDMVDWQYNHPLSRQIIMNWEDIADWWVATGRLRVAQESNHPGVNEHMAHNLANDQFRARWERQVIPVDPSNRIWHLYDIDNERELLVDMRVWRHPYRTGTMLAGFTRESTAVA